MALDGLFSGTALQPVDEQGGLVLPGFVLDALARRRADRRVFFAPHEVDRCISSYDGAHAAWLHAEVERQRLRGEERGEAPDVHHRRARRTFGAAEAAQYDEGGRVVLPVRIRARSRIARAALVVGTGSSFEIWDPETARAAGDEELKSLAEHALAAGIGDDGEVER